MESIMSFGLQRRKKMATVKCALHLRRKPTHEWNDGERDRIYCRGYINRMTDDLLPECVNCHDCVIHAQNDLDIWLDGRPTIMEAEERKDA